MSTYTAIANVGETLLGLLRENMQDLVNPATIILSSPGEIEAEDSPRLSLFLYQITENPHLRNQEMQSLDSTNGTYPPLTLDMHYMLTSYGSPQIADKTERTIEAHRILGRAISILYDNAILRGSLLRGGLAGSGEELKITFQPVPLEELNRIWNSLPNRPFRLSVCYMVTSARIDSTREVDISRVTEKETRYYQIKKGGSP